MDLHEGGTQDIRERRGGGEGVEVGEIAAPGGQVVAGVQGAPERECAGTVCRVRRRPVQDGVPERDEVGDRPQHGHHGEQQHERPPFAPWPRTTGCDAHRPPSAVLADAV
jgi:hypothetical protein